MISCTCVRVTFRDAWVSIKQVVQNQNRCQDIHNELMKKYQSIPQWWFNTIIALSVGFSILNCQVYGDQIQLPTWGFLVAVLVAAIFLLPVGAIKATTGIVSGIFFLIWSINQCLIRLILRTYRNWSAQKSMKIIRFLPVKLPSISESDYKEREAFFIN